MVAQDSFATNLAHALPAPGVRRSRATFICKWLTGPEPAERHVAAHAMRPIATMLMAFAAVLLLT
jgi:hypothetical protein